MKSASWKDVAELFGIAAIVASLIFVGLQMRQTQVIAQATLYQMRSDSAQEIRMAMISPEHLQSALLKQETELTGLERRSLDGLISMALDHFENSHHLYQLGMLSQEQWNSDIEQLSSLLSGDFPQERWNSRKGTYRRSFAEFVDSILQEAIGDK